MAESYEVELWGHPNIYMQNRERKLRVFFSEPEKGINPETGIVLLIAGFSGSATSNVYRKMRDVFADQHNLVTVQCEYFGHEFMMDEKEFSAHFSKKELSRILAPDELAQVYKEDHPNLDLLLKMGDHCSANLTVDAVLHETLNNFNDMGIMQAMDNLVALLSVIAIIKDNGLEFNTRKVIAYGHSHGAYLGYLCNALSPDLFSLIIDNSAWLYPGYLMTPRYRHKRNGQVVIDVIFDYLARRLSADREILSLTRLYERVRNKSRIITFQGSDDQLVKWQDKQNFCEKLSHTEFHLIDSRKVDGQIFRSTGHGLNADFLKLFDKVMQGVSFDQGQELDLRPREWQTALHHYSIHYDSGMVNLKVTD